MAEELPKSGRQGVVEDVFDWHANGGISVLATATRCLPNQLPIGGLITGTPEKAKLDKSFYQVKQVAVFSVDNPR
jgi:hypothetical protein